MKRPATGGAVSIAARRASPRAALAAVAVLLSSPALAQPAPDPPPEQPAEPADSEPLPSKEDLDAWTPPELPERTPVALPVTRPPPKPVARVDERTVGGGDVSGIVEKESEPGDGWRRGANIGLWLPRQIVEGLFLATGAAGSLIEDQQVVPRVRDMIDPPAGQIGAFPTALGETQNTFNVGVRMLARARNYGSSLRVGFGSYNDLVLESRLRVTSSAPLAMALGTQAFHQRRRQSFRGLGKQPATDPRNEFTGTERKARYRETRERWLLTYGVRPSNDVELFVSSSLQRRLIRDPRGTSSRALSTVFVPGSVRGPLEQSEFMYSELALRLDTRATRGGPSTGFLLEGYNGLSTGVIDTEGRFGRTGGRTAGFIKILKSSNILSPKIVLDGLYELDGEVPFYELPDQPDYRGVETRIDFVTAVASLDYRWAVGRYSAARLFVDLATAAPSVDRLNFRHLNWAGGFGLDLFSTGSPLGSAFVSVGPDGARLVVSLGSGDAFGDRQHR